MDFARNNQIARRRRRVFLVAGVAAGAVLIAVVAASIRPAAPAVERATVWLGTVERGPMLLQVRGHGILEPETVRWISAPTTGTVDHIHVEPGDRVAAGDVVIELGNAEVIQQAEAAETALTRVRAEFESLRLESANQNLVFQSEAAAVEAEYVQATMQAEVNRELAAKGLVSTIQLKGSEALAQAMTRRREIALERLQTAESLAAARLDAKRADVDQHEALSRLRRTQRQALLIRAGMEGVIQEVPAEIGQQAAPGTNLARVAGLGRLQAQLRVPANQTGDLRRGLPVRVDTRNGVVSGTLVRIDPAVRQGTVTVDVRLDGELPPGARPDLAVEGTIELARLDGVLHVGRPVHAEEGSTMEIFRLEPDGVHLSKLRVAFGRSSVDAIEVTDGLEEGDEIVLSDTARWHENRRVRLE